MSLKSPDAEKGNAAEETGEIKRRHTRKNNIRNDRDKRADYERQPHHQSGLERPIDFRAAETEHFFLKGAQENVSLLA